MPLILADNSVQTQANKSAQLTAKKAGDLAAATVHLFTNDINPTAGSVVGDFTEPVYAGYAGQPVAGWTANELEADGTVSTVATTVLSFTGPAAGGGPTVYGYYVLSAGGGTPLIYAARFVEPFGLVNDLKTLDVVPTFTQE